MMSNWDSGAVGVCRGLVIEASCLTLGGVTIKMSTAFGSGPSSLHTVVLTAEKKKKKDTSKHPVCDPAYASVINDSVVADGLRSGGAESSVVWRKSTRSAQRPAIGVCVCVCACVCVSVCK